MFLRQAVRPAATAAAGSPLAASRFNSGEQGAAMGRLGEQQAPTKSLTGLPRTLVDPTTGMLLLAGVATAGAAAYIVSKDISNVRVDLGKDISSVREQAAGFQATTTANFDKLEKGQQELQKGQQELQKGQQELMKLVQQLISKGDK